MGHSEITNDNSSQQYCMKNKDSIFQMLFDKEGKDSLYTAIRNEQDPWHAEAKAYWQHLYNQHSKFLDDNYPEEIGNDCISRLWELTLINFLAKQEPKGLKRLHHRSKKKKSPDFCFEINGQRFYLEADAPGAGKAEKLRAEFENFKARETPIVPYKERLCSAINIKGDINYHGGKTPGYKDHIGENAGLIIAVSMAKIPSFNQPIDYRVDLSCILGLSPMKIPIVQTENNERFMGSPYYDHEPEFAKSHSESPIKTNYFTDDAFSHISAILISHTGWVFFPDIDQDKYDMHVRWEDSRNDYILVHNPFAKAPLPPQLFPVYREIFPQQMNSQVHTHTESLV